MNANPLTSLARRMEQAETEWLDEGARTGHSLAMSESSDLAQAIRVVEALLFAAAEPLSAEELAAGLPAGTDLGPVLAHLEELYAGRGVDLVRVAGKWLLRTAEDLRF